ncbi:DUF6151 family protein [Marinicellulosiphila megalodicopiae]|uniref:DUF6151 family protein n=1 Tax=Marinicellulosiphila megalodicopiae TaxID=2724896 RepID=UPI003BAE66C0
MSNSVKLECRCGTVKGSLKIVKRSRLHVQCLCCDCQSFAGHLNNKAHILDMHGATDLVQTYPEYMTITQGHDKICAIQQTQGGIFRWSVSCCNMPLANTMTSAKMPFVGVPVSLMKFSNEQEKQDLLGPITMKAFGMYALGTMPDDVHPTFPKSYLPKIMGFMLKGFILRKHTPSPFFAGKEPVVKVQKIF